MPSPWEACFALGREGLREVCGSSQMNGSMDEGVLLLFSRSGPLLRIENVIDVMCKVIFMGIVFPFRVNIFEPYHHYQRESND